MTSIESTPSAKTSPADQAEGADVGPALRLPQGLRTGHILLALGLGLLAGLSPLTSRELVPSVLAGTALGVGVLLHLRRHGAATPGEAIRPLRVPARDALAFGALLAAYVFALWPTFVVLVDHWTGSLWNNGHGLFMPPAIAYLGWKALRELPDERARGSVWGFAVLVPALALVWLGQSIGFVVLAALGFVLSLPGLALLLFGTRGTRALAVPLVVALLMVPIPNAVASHVYLRQITAAVVGPLFRGLGFLSLREGTVIQTPDQVFVVADACSGFSTLYASVSVAVILAAMAGSLRLGGLLVLAAVPLALLANIVRVLGLVVATEMMGVWVLDSPLHVASGVATFAVSLGGLFWIYGRWKGSGRHAA